MVTRYLILVFLSALLGMVLGAPEAGLSTYQSDPSSYYRRGRQSGYPYSSSYFSGGGSGYRGYGYSQPQYNYNGGYSSSNFGYRNPYYQQQQYYRNPYYQPGYRSNQNYNYPQYNTYQSGYNYNPGFGSGNPSSSYGVVPIPTRDGSEGYAK